MPHAPVTRRILIHLGVHPFLIDELLLELFALVVIPRRFITDIQAAAQVWVRVEKDGLAVLDLLHDAVRRQAARMRTPSTTSRLAMIAEGVLPIVSLSLPIPGDATFHPDTRAGNQRCLPCNPMRVNVSKTTFDALPR